MKNNNMLYTPDAVEVTGGPTVVAPVVEQEILIPDPDNNNTPTKHEQNDDGEPFVARDGFQLTVGEFTGANKGLLFYVPIATTLEVAINKWGEASILKLVNDAVRDSARSHAKATKIPAYENEASQKAAIEALKKTNSGILITMNDAMKLNPTDKRETSGNLAAQIREAKKNPHTTKSELKALAQKFNEALMREAARSGLAD